MKKIIFADQLRALAALSVIFVHLGGGYWAARSEIAARIMAPALEGPSSRMLDLTGTFNFGPFGVSLFFLISGFVIPFSLERLSAARFLAARAFRIYPTYFACIGLSVAAAWLSSRYWHQPFTFDRHSVVFNALLIHNFYGIPSVDMVNWTLAIEVKFYILMAVLALVSLHRNVAAFIAVSLAIALAPVFVHAHGVATVILRNFAFIPYMFIGTMLNLHMHGKVSGRLAVVSMLMLAGIFHSIVFLSHLRHEQLGAVMDIYLSNIAVFSLAYVLRDSFRPNPIVNFLARISYPLYAVHPIVGYASLRFMMARGVPPMASLAATVAFVMCIAYVVHRLIEVPSTRWGKWIASPAAPTVPAASNPS
ncbi:acyltransferase family protein [Paraburkholderia caledonica]